MESVKIDKNELLKIVRENKAKHIKEYNDAVKDFQLAVIKTCNENQEVVTAGKTEIKNMPVKPSTYEANYNRAIRMLELTVDTVIELGTYEFNQLVLDEWEWKQAFSTSNSSYKSFL